MGCDCNTQVNCCFPGELELLLSNALADINTLRSLLYAPPITDIQNALVPSPPTTSTQSRRTIHTQHSIPSSSHLNHCQMSSSTHRILHRQQINHPPLPRSPIPYKYISKAMYDMASENNSLYVNLLWPTFELDPDFSTLYKTQLNLFNYSRVLKKHGLMISFDMHDFEFVNEIGPYLTPTVSVSVRVSLRSEEVAHLLQLLRKYGVECVDYLDVDENNYDDSVVRDWNVLSEIRINKLELKMYDSVPPFMRQLKHIRNLKSVAISTVKGTALELLHDCKSLETIRFFQPAIESVQQLLDFTKKNLNPNLSRIEVDEKVCLFATASVTVAPLFRPSKLRNNELELLLANALSDINTLRYLLHGPPITKIQDALLPTPTTPTPSRYGTHRPLHILSGLSLESLPEVILDRIASFVDADSIISLCHAVPYYKYISKSICDLGLATIDDEELYVESLWPTFEFPSDLAALRNSQLYFLNYVRLLKKHSLTISLEVHELEYLNEVGPFLTPSVSVSCKLSLSSFKMLEILQTLKKYGIGCVDFLDFDENAVDSDSSAIYNYNILSDIKIKKIEFVMYDSVTPFMRNLKHVVGLKEINIFFAKGKSFDFLFDCPAFGDYLFHRSR
ncbi:hypothetical protein BCR33DRAFT_855275 [Rhizoclosmatium globosum]|uniref:F-box domain-containing protein n=1 Tax=Rhizoclosmatium globosum TaxID=329046 RepID=A0A1Y2BP72_9FUNG|nr:hypothetical protein BCR33DRAFT_855275 [Rhizoclosmatium globosum]|eukprot:ORY36554.1 hypothetical protein BCR33DRAFT_855275 [Rhizoclosmatium globosum]